MSAAHTPAFARAGFGSAGRLSCRAEGMGRPCVRVKMAMAMREAAGKLTAAWHRHGCELGFAGIAQG
jgi:hypothetical protein